MTNLEMIQTGLALAGVAGIGGIWFKLGALSGALGGINHRLQLLENAVFNGKGN